MLKQVFLDLIGPEIVASGRAIKVHNIDLFTKHGFSITSEQYLVLDMVTNKVNSTQSELCKFLCKDKSNINRLLSVLEDKNLIVKEQTTENGKLVNRINITPEGKLLRDKIKPIIEESRKQYLDNITNDDMYTCLKVLSKIQENLIK